MLGSTELAAGAGVLVRSTQAAQTALPNRLPARPPACLTSTGTCPRAHPAGSGALAEPQTLINTFWPCSLAVLTTKLQAGQGGPAGRRGRSRQTVMQAP
jgi:hypothetical protein